ncbi:MAG: cohesin domain-containing protein, partial [bacterium]
MITSIKQAGMIFFMLTFLVANPYAATLKIAPPTMHITHSQPFTVNINIEEVADLYGASFDLIFDAAKLTVVKVEEGDFLRQATVSTSFLSRIDNEQGRVVIGLTRLGTVTGVSGSGTLVSITLRAKFSGTATIMIKNTLLKNSQLDVIPATLLDGLVIINPSQVILKITPATTEVLSNQTFTVIIDAKGAIDLYGASLDIIFDPDRLRVIESTEGGFLRQATISTSFLSKIDNEQGRVIMGISRLGQVSGVTGSGSLVAITMKAKSAGTTTLRLANMVMQDSAFDTLEVVPLTSTTIINILPAILKLQTESINVPTNQDVTVNVMIDKVVGLYGASFDILFDPSLLQGIAITAGNFLNQDGLQTA